MFIGHRRCGSGDLMVLARHVISQDDVTKQSYDFMGRSLSKQVNTLQNLVAIATLVLEL